jgi:hypothetical protein
MITMNIFIPDHMKVWGVAGVFGQTCVAKASRMQRSTNVAVRLQAPPLVRFSDLLEQSS